MTTQQRAMLDLLTETAEARIQELVEPLERFRYEMYEAVDAAIADALRSTLEKSFRDRSGSTQTDDRDGQPPADHAHSG